MHKSCTSQDNYLMYVLSQCSMSQNAPEGPPPIKGQRASFQHQRVNSDMRGPGKTQNFFKINSGVRGAFPSDYCGGETDVLEIIGTLCMPLLGLVVQTTVRGCGMSNGVRQTAAEPEY